MPLADRYAHWQQTADDPILGYATMEGPEILTELTEDAAVQVQQAMYARWEARARAIALENAALRAEDDTLWPSL